MSGVELFFRPLEGWPRELTQEYARKAAPFKSSLDQSLRKLRKELALLESGAVVVQTAHRERDYSLHAGAASG